MTELKGNGLYLEIPFDYLCVYHQLLNYLADFGEDALRDCDSTCKGSNKGIIQCWNMFQAAVAAYNLGQYKRANVLMKYIESQLELIYKGRDINEFSAGELYPVDDEGFVYGVVSCRNMMEFYVPTEDETFIQEIVVKGDKQTITQNLKAWNLYVKFLNVPSKDRDFDLITDENKDLIVTSNYIV